MAKQKKSARGFGCAMLFFLPFGLVGIGMAGWSYYQAFEWAAMQSWTESPATILTLNLKESRGGENGDSRTYCIQGTFQYSVDGQNYTSDRISVYTSNDNIGSFHQNAYARFRPLVNRQDEATCFINPANPGDAILIRDARWEMFAFYSIFATVFGSIGVLGILILLVHRREAAMADSQMEIYPDEPWHWHPRWVGERIRSNQADSLRNWVRSSVWWVFATIPACFFSTAALINGDVWAFLGLIPVGLTILIIRGMRRRRRFMNEYGEAHLQCPEFPLRLGMKTTIAAVFSAGELPRQPVEAEIKCEQKVRQHNKTKTRVVWDDQHMIDPDNCRHINNGLAIAVPIDLPDNCPETTTTNEDVTWKLTLVVPTRSKPMTLEFRLPVFQQTE